MTRFLFILVMATLCTPSFAQKDMPANAPNLSQINTVWAKSEAHYPLKKGFYKDYEEFLTNSPSEQRNFTLVEKTKSQERKDNDICAVNFDLDEGEDKLGHLWGFCDGNAAYVKVSPLEGKFWKISYIGPYSYFVHVFQVRTLSSAIVGSAMGTREFSIINSHGKMVVVTENYMRKILGKCPGLAEEYSADDKPKTEELKRAYLHRVNEYLALHP